MKGLVCSLVIMLCASPAYSATLTKIPASQIGETVTTIKGTSSGLLDAVVETTIALNKSGALKAGANAAALTIPLIAKRVIPALGAASAVGYLADCAFDLVKAYDNKWLDDYPLLKSIIDTSYPVSSDPVQGYISLIPNSNIYAKMESKDTSSGYPYYGASGDVTSPQQFPISRQTLLFGDMRESAFVNFFGAIA